MSLMHTGLWTRSERATSDCALAVVSHELRQPLDVIRMNATLLQRLPASTPTSRILGIAEAIQRAIDSQTRIINDLLDVSRGRTDKLTLRRSEVDLGELICALIATLPAHLALDRIRIDIDIAANEALLCFADRLRLEQIVGNLLGNAMKFTPDDGQIRVRLTTDNGFACLRVTDTGCGIAPEFLPHVFGMFNQAAPHATRVNDGFGIGLALVHDLAAAHGGRVSAASEGIDRGAEFCIWLPLLRRPPR